MHTMEGVGIEVSLLPLLLLTPPSPSLQLWPFCLGMGRALGLPPAVWTRLFQLSEPMNSQLALGPDLMHTLQSLNHTQCEEGVFHQRERGTGVRLHWVDASFSFLLLI